MYLKVEKLIYLFNLKNSLLIFRHRYERVTLICCLLGIEPTMLAYALAWNQINNLLLYKTMSNQLNQDGRETHLKKAIS